MNPFIEPLTLLHKKRGTPYERSERVLAELRELLTLPHLERAARVPGAHSESIAYFIRRRKQADEEFYAVVFLEVAKRIVLPAHRICRGLPQIAIEEIVDKVQTQILELLVKDSQNPAGDFFEANFADGVESRTRDAKRAYRRSTMGGKRGWLVSNETDEDGMEIDGLELVADDRAGTEDIVRAIKDKELCHDLFARVPAVVKDPRYVEAAMLFFVEDWPIRSKDKDKATLERHFGATDSQIRYWISVVVKAMRELLEEDAARKRAGGKA